MEVEKSENDDVYFVSYEDLEVSRIMLSDRRRNAAYQKAIETNQEIFEGKTVLDVGAGTGFLSILCAKAKARKVYAVEASSGMIPILRETCRSNNVLETVCVVEGKIEDVDIPEQVDIIISEWMGFHLIHEGMLNSVIYAREKFLKPGGLMIPEKSSIHACLCKIPGLFDFWEDVNGVNLSHVGKQYRRRYEDTPAIMEIDSSDLLSDPCVVVEFDMLTVEDSSLECITETIVAVPFDDSVSHGICLFFKVFMFGEVFSTAPNFSPTHWKQTLVVFPAPVALYKDEGEAYQISLTKANNRQYAIELIPLDADEVTHPIGCKCSMARCRIIRAYMDQQEADKNTSESV